MVYGIGFTTLIGIWMEFSITTWDLEHKQLDLSMKHMKHGNFMRFFATQYHIYIGIPASKLLR